MNRTIKEATVKRYHYDNHDQLRQHLGDFVAAYNFGRRLKTLDGLTPYEAICKTWLKEPHRFASDPTHQIPGPNTYGQVKLVAALWMASLARRHPELRFVTMSPGNTSGTDVARDFPLPVRILMKYVLMPVVMPLFGIVQSVDKGAKRHVEALNDPALKSGVFYASKADALTGPVVDQSTIMPELVKATITASSSTDSTVDLTIFGPVGRSAVEVRRFHLATVFWLMPWRLASVLRLA